jgi:hypothetical protein
MKMEDMQTLLLTNADVGVVVYTCNSSTQKQEDHKFEASLSYIVQGQPGLIAKLHLKKKNHW